MQRHPDMRNDPLWLVRIGYEMAVGHANEGLEIPGFNQQPTLLPTTFPQQNMMLTSPVDASGERDPNVFDIPAHRHQYGLITVWKMTQAQAETMLKTRRIFVCLNTFRVPPMMLQAHSPFLELEEGS